MSFPYKFPFFFNKIGFVLFKGGGITGLPDGRAADLASGWEHPLARMRRLRRGG